MEEGARRMRMVQEGRLLQDENPQIMDSFRRYIADEYMDKRKEAIDTMSWPIRYIQLFLYLFTGLESLHSCHCQLSSRPML